MTKSFLIRTGIGGVVLGMATMAGFLIGYKDGNTVLASTMAFSVLCLSRLLHGYSCKSEKPVLFTRRFFNNKYMQGACGAGIFLLTAVLTIPALHGFFAVQTLTLNQLLIVYGLAASSLLVMQFVVVAKNFRNHWS